MSTLLCIGLGYCARHYVAMFGDRFAHIIGTTRNTERAAALAQARFGGRSVEMLVFDGTAPSPELREAVADADALLVSATPGPHGDPVLAGLADEVLRAPELSSVVLLSTVSVYGDHRGGWVEELTPPAPVSARGHARLEAEQAWAALGARAELAVAILRLAGIYGPGQNALVALRHGTAKRIVKPGQVFNRIHVGDIAQAIEAAITKRANGTFNVCDDLPSPPGDPITFAATLLGVPVPREIEFAEAAKTMTPMALSFYGENKRVANDRLKQELGVTLRYPTYREGLRALYAAGAAPDRTVLPGHPRKHAAGP